MWILYLLIGAVVALFVLAYLANKQVKSYFFQYAYFTRYATFYGLVLFFLPAAAFLAPSIAANLSPPLTVEIPTAPKYPMALGGNLRKPLM